MNIGVLGLWHLGLVNAVGLSCAGHNVIGLCENDTELKNLLNGLMPVFEPKLDELCKEVTNSKKLTFLLNQNISYECLNVLLVAYDTPVNRQDQADTDYVMERVKKAILNLQNNTTVVISSQLPVGSVRQLEDFTKKHLPKLNINFASVPENLRLGDAFNVFLNPDRVVVGCRTDETKNIMRQMFAPITDNILYVGTESAEMIKHSINSFLAMSVVFANEIAAVCEHVGADGQEVAAGLKTDQRIGKKAYLSPGSAFSGGTLARDINYLNAISREAKLGSKIFSAVRNGNSAHRLWVKKQIEKATQYIEKPHITIWGLTYKQGTDTLRRSEMVELVRWLSVKGLVPTVYEPNLTVLPSFLKKLVNHENNPMASLKDKNILVIGNTNSLFHELCSQIQLNNFVVIDPSGELECKLAGECKVYIKVGKKVVRG